MNIVTKELVHKAVRAEACAPGIRLAGLLLDRPLNSLPSGYYNWMVRRGLLPATEELLGQLQGVNLEGADLSSANLEGAYLK